MHKNFIKPLGSLRFILIAYIVVAHFIRFATIDPFLLRFFSQHNMLVGSFFALSGYLMSYSYIKATDAETRALSFGPFIKKRLARIYPLHFFVLLLFSPLFIYVDLYYGHGLKTVYHAFLVFSLTQAWLPSSAESWNSPSWFLSAIFFSYSIFPFIQKPIARLKVKDIRKVLAAVFFFSLGIKIAYSNYCGWMIMEGLQPIKALWLFNLVRFNPLINFLDFAMGIFTARLVLLSKNKIPAILSTELLFTALLSLLFLRCFVDINDMIARTLLFLPLSLLFFASLESGKGPLCKALSSPFSLYLGEISFALYIVHGAIGQLFYKKAIKQLFFQEPVPIVVFYISVLVAAITLHHLLEKPLGKRLSNLIKS